MTTSLVPLVCNKLKSLGLNRLSSSGSLTQLLVDLNVSEVLDTDVQHSKEHIGYHFRIK